MSKTWYQCFRDELFQSLTTPNPAREESLLRFLWIHSSPSALFVWGDWRVAFPLSSPSSLISSPKLSKEVSVVVAPLPSSCCSEQNYIRNKIPWNFKTIHSFSPLLRVSQKEGQHLKNSSFQPKFLETVGMTATRYNFFFFFFSWIGGNIDHKEALCLRHEVFQSLAMWEGWGASSSCGITHSLVFHRQSTCDPVPNHSESLSHTVTVPLQAPLGTLEEIACWPLPTTVPIPRKENCTGKTGTQLRFAPGGEKKKMGKKEYWGKKKNWKKKYGKKLF